MTEQPQQHRDEWAAPPPPSWGPPPGGGTPPSAAAPPPLSSAPGWQQLPPEELAQMHHPGIVPLRPLTVGDVFGGALQTMRRNPTATVGAGFLVLTLLLVPSYLASVALLRVQALAVEDRAALVPLVGMLFSMLASVALTGMIVHVVGEAVLGDKVSLAQTWRAVRGRIPALLGTLLLMTLLMTLLLVVAVLLAVLVAVVAPQGSEVALILLAVVGVLGTALLLVWVGVRLSLASAAVVLEKVGPWRGLRRAWSLTRGVQGWRVIGITLLAGILTLIFTSAVQIPMTLAVVTLTDLDPISDAGMTSPVVVGADHLVQLVVNAFAIPFTAGVTALLYLDQRIRREGLDTTLIHTAQARAAARRT